jgi:hypothetical protein
MRDRRQDMPNAAPAATPPADANPATPRAVEPRERVRPATEAPAAAPPASAPPRALPAGDAAKPAPAATDDEKAARKRKHDESQGNDTPQ